MLSYKSYKIFDPSNTLRQRGRGSIMLEYINDPNDIKQIQPEDYKLLAKDIRRFLLRNVSRTGGHLASNLGIVELTMALHLVLDFPKDQLIFDVGHQSYVHKILTGRKNGFENLRQFHGMSGFPKRKESDCDAFHSGHSSMGWLQQEISIIRMRRLLR